MVNVTINNISVIYVTAHSRAGGLKKNLDIRSGSQRHRHFVGFFNVPVLHRHGSPFLYDYSETPPHLVAIYDRLGIRRTHSRLTLPPLGPHGGSILKAAVKGSYFTCHFQRNMSTSSLPHSSQSVKRLWRSEVKKCESFTPDGRTDNGREIMAIANLNL